MMRVNANFFRQAILLWPLIVFPSVALADAGYDAKKEPLAMEGMDHMKMNRQDDVAAMHGHWMAPEAAAKRPNPVKANNASRARGKKLFAANCASCHGAGARGDGPAGAALNPRPADLTVMAGRHPDGDFAWKIANGRGPMPAWNGQLSEKNIWDLVNFIQGLAGPKENSQPGAGHQHNHPH
jgi:mono/diheme cytochrome c family protein